jgi:putative resolvase
VTGTILVESPALAVGAAVAYCRVSSADLERQVGRVAEECGTRGITLAATITEIGSGVFGNRAKRQKLPDGAVSVVRAAYRFALDPTPPEQDVVPAVTAAGSGTRSTGAWRW